MTADVLGAELDAREVSQLVGILQKPEALSNSGRALDDYINRIRERRRDKAQGLDPVFHESNIGLSDTDVWK